MLSLNTISFICHARTQAYLPRQSVSIRNTIMVQQETYLFFLCWAAPLAWFVYSKSTEVKDDFRPSQTSQIAKTSVICFLTNIIALSAFRFSPPGDIPNDRGIARQRRWLKQCLLLVLPYWWLMLGVLPSEGYLYLWPPVVIFLFALVM